MKHLNNDMLCSIGIRTTGPLPYHNDLVQIGIIPLTYSVTPRLDILPFDMAIIPGRPENIEYAKMDMRRKVFIELQQRAMEPSEAADLFEYWFDKLNLRFNKRIQCIGFNTPRSLAFIQDWLGPNNFERFFDIKHRDVMTAALYLNDHADFTGQPYPVQKLDLPYLCSTFKIEYPTDSRDALSEALVCAEIWKNLMQKNVTTYEQHQRAKMAKLLSSIKAVGHASNLSEEILNDIANVLKNEKVDYDVQN